MITITLSEDNARMIASALELQSRLLCGQLKELNNLFFFKDYDREAVDYALKQLKILLFPELTESGYYGIYQDESKGTALDGYEVYKQILYHFHKDDKSPCVHSFEPMITNDENKITIEESEK
jgi:hypothetical protein